MPVNRLDQYNAQNALSKALKKGTLARPTACELCGAVGIIHGHHWKGYDPENALNIQWLCPKCHRREHPSPPVRPGVKRSTYGRGRDATLQVRITPALSELIEAEAIEKNISVSQLIRSILVAAIEKDMAEQKSLTDRGSRI